MRYLKRYENDIAARFERANISQSARERLYKAFKDYGIMNCTINDDESVDVNIDIDLSYESLYELPMKFGSVNGYFVCCDNFLTSLADCPKSVSGYFNCSHNILTSLKGAPKHIGGDFWCIYNQINTFEGLDFIDIGADFHCEGNPIWYIWRLFEDYTKFEFFNDCDPIRENRVIILDRLNFFLDYIGKKTVTEVSGYKCI
jgi:hypothetical protein